MKNGKAITKSSRQGRVKPAGSALEPRGDADAAGLLADLRTLIQSARQRIAIVVRFVEALPDEAIVATLSQQLSWSHFMAILPILDPLAREFYAEMCRIERWDVRTLRKKIDGMLFQRTALALDMSPMWYDAYISREFQRRHQTHNRKAA